MIKIREKTGGEMKCREHGQSRDYWCTKEGELVCCDCLILGRHRGHHGLPAGGQGDCGEHGEARNYWCAQDSQLVCCDCLILGVHRGHPAQRVDSDQSASPQLTWGKTGEEEDSGEEEEPMTSLNDALTPPPVLESSDEERAFLLPPPKHNMNNQEKLEKVKMNPTPSMESTPGLGLKACEKPGGKVVGATEEVRERIRQLERDYTSRGLVSSALARAGQEMEVQIVEGRNTPSLQPISRQASTVATFPRPIADLIDLPADLQRLVGELGQPGLPLLSASQAVENLLNFPVLSEPQALLLLAPHHGSLLFAVRQLLNTASLVQSSLSKEETEVLVKALLIFVRVLETPGPTVKLSIFHLGKRLATPGLSTGRSLLQDLASLCTSQPLKLAVVAVRCLALLASKASCPGLLSSLAMLTSLLESPDTSIMLQAVTVLHQVASTEETCEAVTNSREGPTLLLPALSDLLRRHTQRVLLPSRSLTQVLGSVRALLAPLLPGTLQQGVVGSLVEALGSIGREDTEGSHCRLLECLAVLRVLLPQYKDVQSFQSPNIRERIRQLEREFRDTQGWGEQVTEVTESKRQETSEERKEEHMTGRDKTVVHYLASQKTSAAYGGKVESIKQAVEPRYLSSDIREKIKGLPLAQGGNEWCGREQGLQSQKHRQQGVENLAARSKAGGLLGWLGGEESSDEENLSEELQEGASVKKQLDHKGLGSMRGAGGAVICLTRPGSKADSGVSSDEVLRKLGNCSPPLLSSSPLPTIMPREAVTKGSLLSVSQGQGVELWLVARFTDLMESTASLAALLCGFLNGKEGGVLYIGVERGGKVWGLPLNRAQRDKVRQLVDTVLRSMITPRVPPFMQCGQPVVEPDFLSVLNPGGNCQDLHLVRVRVGGGLPGTYRVIQSRDPGVQDGVYVRRGEGREACNTLVALDGW